MGFLDVMRSFEAGCLTLVFLQIFRNFVDTDNRQSSNLERVQLIRCRFALTSDLLFSKLLLVSRK